LDQTFEEAIERVAVHWLQDVNPREGQQIQLILHKFPFDRMNHLLLKLRQAGGARETVVDSTDAESRSQIRLITNQAAVNIAALLLKIDPGIRIVKSSKYTIEVEAATEQWTPVSTPVEKLRDSWAPPALETTSELIEQTSDIQELKTNGDSSAPEKPESTNPEPRKESPEAEKASIAVMEFKVMGKIPAGGQDAGSILCDAMISEIDSDRFEVYERSQLKLLLQEKGFQESALVSSPAKAAQFGKLAGVQYLVLGSLSYLAGQYTLSARLVDSQSGKVKDRDWVAFRSFGEWPRRIPELVNLVGLRLGSSDTGRHRPPTENDLVNSVNLAPGFTIEIDTVDKRHTYLEGEYIGFRVKVSRDCFVTLITVDSEGRMTLLLPNAYQQRAFVRRGEVVNIPGVTAGFRFPIKPPHGETLVKAIATLKPLALSGVTNQRIREERFVTLERGVKAIGGQGRPIDLNELLKSTEWSTAELTVVTQARGRL
jgi:TolB-like protein